MKEVQISKNNDGQRLDKYLIKYFPGTSPSFLYKMLRKKNIVLNGAKATGKEIIKEGDTIKVFFSDETFDKFRGSQKSQPKATVKSSSLLDNPAFKTIKVLYENDDIIILDKPAGVLSQTDDSQKLIILLVLDYTMSFLNLITINQACVTALIEIQVVS